MRRRIFFRGKEMHSILTAAAYFQRGPLPFWGVYVACCLRLRFWFMWCEHQTSLQPCRDRSASVRTQVLAPSGGRPKYSPRHPIGQWILESTLGSISDARSSAPSCSLLHSLSYLTKWLLVSPLLAEAARAPLQSQACLAKSSPPAPQPTTRPSPNPDTSTSTNSAVPPSLKSITRPSGPSVALISPPPQPPHLASQLVPRQDLSGCRRRLLYRCVCGRLTLSLSSPISNFLASYDIFAINIASTMLGFVYGPGQPMIPSLSFSPSHQLFRR